MYGPERSLKIWRLFPPFVLGSLVIMDAAELGFLETQGTV